MGREESFYSEIQSFIEDQLRSNFLASKRGELYVYWGIGELKSNLQRIILEHPEECRCVRGFAERVPPLSLDIFSLITNGKKFELLILEIKLVPSAGLSEWSQLMGYCLVSGAKYGLLINIDNGGSTRLVQMLTTERHISYIQTIVSGYPKNHMLGFMKWNSITHNFEYKNYGYLRSLSDLSDKLVSEFE